MENYVTKVKNKQKIYSNIGKFTIKGIPFIEFINFLYFDKI